MDKQSIQIFQQTQAPPRQEPSRPPQDRQDGESFSRQLEKKLAAERPKNLLKPRKAEGPSAARNQTSSASKAKEKNTEEPASPAESVASLLARLMADLQSITKDQGMQPGDYPLSKSDEGIIALLAESAGLDQASLSQLLDKLEKGNLSLSDLFSTLGKHFQALTEASPISVPDTELPLLASFLQRMGASASTLDAVATQALTGDDRLDLAKFLQALDGVKAPDPIVLSAVDREQLEALLAKAGVAKDFLAKLFPAQAPGQTPFHLENLKEVLARALADIDQNRPKAEFPAFMQELKTLLSQTGFSEKEASWSPVLQQTMTDVQRQLGKLVDMATVQAQKVEDAVDGEWEDAGDLTGMEDQIPSNMDKPVVNVASAEGGAEALATPVENGIRHETLPEATHQAPVAPSTPNATPELHAPRPAAPTHPLPHTMRELVFQQLTDGIHHGLRNREHHLVLRLYPPELGEVKVDLLVRDDHVTVNFAMENRRVKDILESSMQEFKDSLEQRGFVLNGCNVSVDQQGRGDDLWQRWLEAGGQEQTPSYRTVRDLPEETLYHTPNAAPVADGVNLFV